MNPEPCPCGSGKPYPACCQPYITGLQPAPTAEALMRSRYSAYVLQQLDHLRRSWHPDTLPATLQLDPDARWLGLQVKRCEHGGVDDHRGTVEFVARFKVNGRGHRLHERSRFVRLGGYWVYVDGDRIKKSRRR